MLIHSGCQNFSSDFPSTAPWSPHTGLHPQNLLSTSKQWETPTAIKAHTQIFLGSNSLYDHMIIWLQLKILPFSSLPSFTPNLSKAHNLNFPTSQRGERFKESNNTRTKIIFSSWCIVLMQQNLSASKEWSYHLALRWSIQYQSYR